MTIEQSAAFVTDGVTCCVSVSVALCRPPVTDPGPGADAGVVSLSGGVLSHSRAAACVWSCLHTMLQHSVNSVAVLGLCLVVSSWLALVARPCRLRLVHTLQQAQPLASACPLVQWCFQQHVCTLCTCACEQCRGCDPLGSFVGSGGDCNRIWHYIM